MRRLEWYYAVVITAALAVGGWCGVSITRHANTALDSFAAAGQGIKQTTDHVNGKTGTIAMMDENMGAAKSLIIHADLVARHEQQSLNVWDERGAELYANVNGAVTDARGTITAATGTANAATATIQEGQRTVKAVQPILADADTTVQDVHNEAVATLMATKETAQHAAAIGDSGAKVANHYEQAIDNPKKEKWYIRILPETLKELVEAGVTYASMH